MELRSGTDYLVTVIAQYPNSVGDSVSAKQKTSEYTVMHSEWWQHAKQNCSTIYNDTFLMSNIGSLPGVSSLRLVQAGFFSLSLSWSRPTVPVQGYRLTYGPQGQKLLLLPSLSALPMFSAEQEDHRKSKEKFLQISRILKQLMASCKRVGNAELPGLCEGI